MKIDRISEKYHQNKPPDSISRERKSLLHFESRIFERGETEKEEVIESRTVFHLAFFQN
jgi:hypothetical protein